MKNLLAIDPGTTESAYVILNDGALVAFSKVSNETMCVYAGNYGGEMVYEMVACYGLPVGKEIFETVLWMGRFIQANKGCANRLYRQDVKLHLCKSPKANDATIRQALIDRFGPGKDKAIGKKANPGPLFGVTKDCWSALALACTWHDKVSA